MGEVDEDFGASFMGCLHHLLGILDRGRQRLLGDDIGHPRLDNLRPHARPLCLPLSRSSPTR
jgi:hypothetical protein